MADKSTENFMATCIQSKAAREALCARSATALRIVVVVSLVAACVMALAQTRPVTLELEDLERAFWACDSAATTRGVHGAAGVACGNATEQLKQRKFNGDFAAMLAWWRENKAAMHQLVLQAEGEIEQQAGNGALDVEVLAVP